MPESPKKASLIVNPTAGRGRCAKDLPRIRRLLAEQGLDATYHFTTCRGDAERLAREAIEAGVGLVVPVGGDGTLHEVANALLKAGRADVSLGLIPFGTGNDFARAVGLYGNVEKACLALITGKRARVDVGAVEAEGIASPYYFLVAAGVGFVADTAKTVNEGVRRLRGAPAYISGALLTLRRFAPLALTIQLDEDPPKSLDAMLVSVSNVATTGGGMRIAPEARPDDGCLDICLVSAIPKIELAKQLPGVFAGRHVSHPAVSILRARRVAIQTAKPASLWIDGEVTGSTPVSFTLLPAALPIMLPADQR